VGAPAVKLLSGYGEHADPGRDKDAALDEMPHYICVARHAKSQDQDNATNEQEESD
jgi:hypothetical protein